MRRLSYFILAYLVLGVQVGLRDYLSFRGASPNLVLLAAIWLALHAPRNMALLACFTLGLLQDLLTAQPPGVYALSYGLVALFVVSSQQVVHREHPLTHVALAVAGGLIVAAVLLMHEWVHPAAPRSVAPAALGGGALPAVRVSVSVELIRVLYTAVAAQPVLWCLNRVRGAFAFQVVRKRAWR